MAEKGEEALSRNAAGPRTVPRRTASGFAKLLAFIERANRVARERKALMRLDDNALKDFGASRADAWHEGEKPWWDLPPHGARSRGGLVE